MGFRSHDSRRVINILIIFFYIINIKYIIFPPHLYSWRIKQTKKGANCQTIPETRNHDRGWGITRSPISQKEENIKYLQKYDGWKLGVYILLKLLTATLVFNHHSHWIEVQHGCSLFTVWALCCLKLAFAESPELVTVQKLPQCPPKYNFSTVQTFSTCSDCLCQTWRLRHAHVNILAWITFSEMIKSKMVGK